MMTNSLSTVLAFDPVAHNQMSEAFRIGTFVVSNHLFMMFLSAIVLGVGMPLVFRRPALVPTGWQNLVEAVCGFLREEVVQPILGERTDRYIGFVWTMFFFILTLNLLGMIPLDYIIRITTGKSNHLAGAASANIYVTGALALVTFFMTHAAGVREQGFGHYMKHFIPHGPWWLVPLLFVVETIGIFVKPFSLALRLFANIIAGHMVLATFVGLIIVFQNYLVAVGAVGAAVMMSLLEILVAFIQAFIFAFLSALYIGFASAPEH